MGIDRLTSNEIKNGRMACMLLTAGVGSGEVAKRVGAILELNPAKTTVFIDLAVQHYCPNVVVIPPT